MTQLDRHNFKKELANHDPVFPESLIEQAKEDFKLAMTQLACTSAVIETRIAMLCDPVYTSAIDTLAVTAKPGTGIILAINPEFFSLRLPDTFERIKAVVHEALHVEMKHLHTDHTGENWTLACEVMCNHTMMNILKCQMFEAHPKDEATGVIDTSTKEEFAINPRTVWEKYRDDLKKQNKNYVSYDEFTVSDLVCLSELNKMEKPAKPPRGKGGWGCSHSDGAPGNNGQPLPFDPEEVSDSMDEIIDSAVQKASQGDDSFKDALKRMFGSAEGSEKASKMWGDFGVGELFGEATTRRQVKFWEQWLKRNLGTRLRPGRNLRFNRKTVAVDHQLRRDPILAYRGKKRVCHLWVAIDTSGSMSTEQLNWVRKYVGEEKSIEVSYFNFDTDLIPIELGDAFQGRGGTNFDCIEEGYSKAKTKPDCVLVFTDGYAPEIEPKDKRKWVWLITADGDDWPRSRGMATYKMPSPSAS